MSGALLLAACQFDTSPIQGAASGRATVSSPSGRAGTGAQSGHDAGHTLGTAGQGTGGGAAVDAGHPPKVGVLDAGSTSGQPKPAVDAGHTTPPPDAGTTPAADAGHPAPDTGTSTGEPLPALEPGGLFARCTSDLSCNNNLPCYNNGPGYCAESCAKDSDCTDYEGVDFTCYLPQGACRVDCSTSGTNGRCPSNLVCAVDSTDQTRCLLPRENGSGDKKLFEPCDIAHGSGDCMSGLTCYRAPLTQVDGPGYCTHPCPFIGGGTGMGMGSSCPTGPMDPSFECTVGACALICDNQDPCKSGMSCEDINQQGYCHYPAGM